MAEVGIRGRPAMRFSPKGQDSRLVRYITSPMISISPFLRLGYRDNRANHNINLVPGRWNLVVYERVDKVTSKLSGLVIEVERELDVWWSVLWYAWRRIKESLTGARILLNLPSSRQWMSFEKLDNNGYSPSERMLASPASIRHWEVRMTPASQR